MKRRIFISLALLALPLVLLWILAAQYSWLPRTVLSGNGNIRHSGELVWSSDGKWLAYGGLESVHESRGFNYYHTIQIYDVTWQRRISSRRFEMRGEFDGVQGIAFPTDKSQIFVHLGTFGVEQRVYEWNLQSGSVRTLVDVQHSVSLCPQGRFIVESFSRKHLGLIVWDGKTGRKRHTSLVPPPGYALGYASKKANVENPIWRLSPDGNLGVIHLYRLSKPWREAGLLIFDVSTGRHFKRIGEQGQQPLIPLCFSHDKRLLATLRQEGRGVWQIQIFDTSLGRKMPKIPVNCEVQNIEFSPDGTQIALKPSSGFPRDFVVSIYATKTGKLLRTVKHGEEGISDFAFSPDSNSLATSSADGTVQIWRVR